MVKMDYSQFVVEGSSLHKGTKKISKSESSCKIVTLSPFMENDKFMDDVASSLQTTHSNLSKLAFSSTVQQEQESLNYVVSPSSKAVRVNTAPPCSMACPTGWKPLYRWPPKFSDQKTSSPELSKCFLQVDFTFYQKASSISISPWHIPKFGSGGLQTFFPYSFNTVRPDERIGSLSSPQVSRFQRIFSQIGFPSC